MGESRILITGGSGRLGTELKRFLPAQYFGLEEWDLRGEIPDGQWDLIVHMAAYTDVVKAETERDECFSTNVTGTFRLLDKFPKTPVIYISTEYAHEPLGLYAKTKRWGEEIVKDHPAPHLILRTMFKPTPWPYEFAYEDQWTNGDYVDVVAMLLAVKIRTWNRKKSDFQYLGTGTKTLLELARRTRKDVKPNKVEEYNEKLGVKLVPTQEHKDWEFRC